MVARSGYGCQKAIFRWASHFRATAIYHGIIYTRSRYRFDDIAQVFGGRRDLRLCHDIVISFYGECQSLP